MALTKDQILMLGNGARTVLSDPTIAFVCDYILSEAARSWMLSQPHEKNSREDKYHLLRALNEITDTLKQLVAAADSLVADNAADKEE